MIYLAGPIDQVSSEEASTWREIATRYLKEYHDMTVFDPYLAFGKTGIAEPIATREVNVAAIRECSVILANVDHSVPAWGTSADIQIARSMGKEIVVWASKGGVPAYLVDLPCFFKLEHACEQAAQFQRTVTEFAGLPSMFQPIHLLYAGGGIDEPKLAGDVGYDLHAMEETELEPWHNGDGYTKVAIGNEYGELHLAIPEDTWGSVWLRSSMVAAGLVATGTVIDPGYRGPIFAFIANLGRDTYHINPGDRVAQLVLFPRTVYPTKVVALDELPQSERGANGFGSTGK